MTADLTRWRRRQSVADRAALARLEALLLRAGRRPLRLEVGPRLARLQELRRARAGITTTPPPSGKEPTP